MHHEPTQSTARSAGVDVEAALSRLVGGLGLAVWRLDLGTRRLTANADGFRVVGCEPPADLAAGLPIEEVRSRIHPDDLAGVERAARAAMEPGAGVVDVEARYRQPDGHYRTLLTRRIVERGGDGQALALVGLSLDVSQQVRARDAAEARARDRAAAEAASQVKNRYLASVSDELRTPLNAVLGFAQLLLDDDEPLSESLRRQHLRAIHEAGRQLLDRVNATLDRASAGAGAPAMQDEPVGLSGIVAQALRAVEPAAADAGVAIGRGSLHGAVRADARHLLDILGGCLAEAVRRTPRGGEVAIAQRDDGGGGRIALEIVDDGGGALDAPAEGEDGLAAVQRLVERMGGEVEVAVAHGAGTCVRLWLRAATPADIVRLSSPAPAAAPPGDAASAVPVPAPPARRPRRRA